MAADNSPPRVARAKPARDGSWARRALDEELKTIVDHYPIRGSWFSFAPNNSIRQINGAWTTLTWRAAGG